jgi:anti-sigma-K factor RskA
VRHRIAAQRCNRRRILRKIGVALQRLANESESGVGGEIRLGFRNEETAQRDTCQVMWATAVFYRYPVVFARVCEADGLLKITDSGTEVSGFFGLQNIIQH